MTRAAVAAVAVAAAALAAGAGPARATSECKGLMVCVRVVGPWVVVPAAASIPRRRVAFELSCPRGFIVGGLDAELSDRGIDIGFEGKLGSPVNPGITTGRAALFFASYTGRARRAATFRPHLGCIPATGGGGGPVPFRWDVAAATPAVFPPGQPTVRRVTTVRLRADATQTVARRCAGGERLVGGWHAVAFDTARAPGEALVGGVVATRAFTPGRVTAVVRSGLALRGVAAIVQVGAVCAGGS